MYGFATENDAVRVGEATRWVESFRAPDRGRSGRQSINAPTLVCFGVTDAAINKSTFGTPGSGGTVSVWTFTGTSFAGGADSGQNITAFNFWGNVGSGKQVMCELTPYGWIITDAEC